MAIAQPIDVVTPATRKRQQLAQQLQQQYNASRGTQKQANALNNAALHAMPLFAGAGARDSLTLPSAPLPQLTVPFLQSKGIAQGLGVVNPASPNSPNVSQAPGLQAGMMPPGLGVTQSSNPNAPSLPQQDGQGPQAGDGTYADGSQAQGPIMDPNMLLRNFGSIAGVRRLYGPGGAGGQNPGFNPGSSFVAF